MRHRVKGRKLKRTASHRLALLRSLATSLLKHKKIKTTVAKAKELRTFVEPIITRAKENTVHARRVVNADIKDRAVVKELFDEIAPKVGERPGGYTRVVKLGQRKGDAAEMAIIELVDYSGIVKPKESKSKKEETKPTEEKKSEVKEEKKEKKASKPRTKKVKEEAEQPKEKKPRKSTKKEQEA